MFKGFQKPKRLVANTETLNERYGMFTAQPFERGFGSTIGTGLRRVLLSSIEGAAITAVRIEGVAQHTRHRQQPDRAAIRLDPGRPHVPLDLLTQRLGGPGAVIAIVEAEQVEAVAGEQPQPPGPSSIDQQTPTPDDAQNEKDKDKSGRTVGCIRNTLPGTPPGILLWSCRRQRTISAFFRCVRSPRAHREGSRTFHLLAGLLVATGQYRTCDPACPGARTEVADEVLPCTSFPAGTFYMIGPSGCSTRIHPHLSRSQSIL